MYAILTELIGTFVFLTVILNTGQAIPIALALAGVIYFGGHLSGGHFNPAVSTMMLMKGSLPVDRWVGYVAAQVLGGLLALLWWTLTSQKGSKHR